MMETLKLSTIPRPDFKSAKKVESALEQKDRDLLMLIVSFDRGGNLKFARNDFSHLELYEIVYGLNENLVNAKNADNSNREEVLKNKEKRFEISFNYKNLNIEYNEGGLSYLELKAICRKLKQFMRKTASNV